MGQGIRPHRAVRLSGNGDFRSFEPELCCWQIVIRDPPLGPIAQFSQATLIEENHPSHLATLHEEAPTAREQKLLPRRSASPTKLALSGPLPRANPQIGRRPT